MSDQNPVQLATALVSAFNNNDWDTYRQNLTADSVYDEVPTARTLEGVEAVVEALKGWKEAFPDIKGTVGNAMSTGNTAVLEVSWTGTHTAPMQGPTGTIAATGKQQTTRSAWVLDFDGGKLKQSRQYFDMLSLMQQLGQS